VALFNILQEGDVQIRGFKLRLPLDILFVFTANPEDYTNRGTIITPLKDRIESQILTHYPRTMDVSRTITEQEARLVDAQRKSIKLPNLVKNLVEQVAIEARQSEFVDQKSGVSARLTISAYELLHSAVERRMLLNKQKQATARVTDFWGIMPAITGKVELVYEGEQEGPEFVANKLIGNAIKTQFLEFFPNPEDLKNRSRQQGEEEGGSNNEYHEILDWFAKGKNVDLLREATDENYRAALDKVTGLQAIVKKYAHPKTDEDAYLLKELVLYGLSEFGQINRDLLEEKASFKDFLSDMFDDEDLRDLRG
jgi:magnesium chelatase subunit I